jgi:hypothetical protein
MTMTIKHVRPDGHERVFEAEAIDRLPDGQLVFATEEKITTGKVYVMNDAGKTVAVYDCTKKP